MRNDKLTPRKLTVLFIRLIILLVVWGMVVYFIVSIASTYMRYRSVSRELAQVSREYDKMFKAYSEQLWEGDRLKNDRQYQRQILKNSYYYYEPDEQPLIVVDQ